MAKLKLSDLEPYTCPMCGVDPDVRGSHKRDGSCTRPNANLITTFKRTVRAKRNAATKAARTP